MRAVLDVVDRIAPSRTTVLLTGESGTGKERVARALHARSERASGAFVVVNCGALPEALMESELFGHEKGAFTGAVARSEGIFREASGGTVLLDEVGELPLPLQVKLLRVLQERKIRPVGGAREIDVDVRVVAATNRDIEAEVQAGRFREDLYYRLNVIRIELPRLSERREDIAMLARSFVQRYATEMGKALDGLTPGCVEALERYDFPGNVRELENICERAVALASGRAIGLADLPPQVVGAAAEGPTDPLELPEGGCDLEQVLAGVERSLLEQALERTRGGRTAAAELLGISFRSLRYRLAKHSLDAEDTADDGDPGGD